MAELYINHKNKVSHIEPEVYGHFSEHLGRCIYEGIYVGENSDIPNVNGMRKDVVEALKAIDIPVLRWPGGCFADEYHWMDGVGPKNERKKMINTHWGGVTEDNSFGTHEFFELLRQLGAKAYVNGNVGSGTVQEMSEWVEYMTFGGVSPMAELRKKNGHEEPWTVSYFGVGNENWGCGGNMPPEYYGNLYRRYQTYVRQYNPDRQIKKVCCGPNVDDYHWTEGVLKTCFDHTPEKLHGFMDFLSLHYYDVPGGWNPTPQASATNFDETEWFETMKRALYMDELVTRHGAIMDRYDPGKLIGLSVDEWGDWFAVEPGTNPGFLYQQNAMRDALVAGVTLNIFNKHSDRVRMACVAQMVNVLQSVLLTEGEKMVKTPTYHVFHMYRHHQDADLLESSLTGVEEIGPEEYRVPSVTESVSEKDGIITITLSNMDPGSSHEVDIHLSGAENLSVKEARLVTGAMQAHNDFDTPDVVKEEAFSGISGSGNTFKADLPAVSVVEIRLG